jgi:MFS family permease
MKNSVKSPAIPNAMAAPAESAGRRTRWINWSSFIFALLQSACTAVLAVSGIRVVIGLGALAAAAGTNAPARGFHQDAIRIPMMILALAGALINLYVLWRQWSLRRRPSSQWRIQPLTAKEKRSQWLQFVLAIVTLALLGLEWWTHTMLHHPH